jgi:hypothetical protein
MSEQLTQQTKFSGLNSKAVSYCRLQVEGSNIAVHRERFWLDPGGDRVAEGEVGDRDTLKMDEIPHLQSSP